MELIRKIKIFIINNKFLNNLYKTKFDKSVLISYTIIPFIYQNSKHTNNQESKVIADIFNKLGYNVDIVHYTNQNNIKYSKYQIIFGFGEPFENSFKYKNLKRIYYATGAHVFHQNYAEIKRIDNANIRHNATILPKRLVPWTWSLSTSLSDSLIVIGNEWTKSTYTKYTNKEVLSINATALININSKKIIRDINKTKKNFLWFGSSGLVHKGLDLCLEYFIEHKDLTLHICGPMENDFKEVFAKYLEKENIHYYGFINVDSQNFIDIVSNCSFTILPTCSEGQATSLLTTMGAGLIPISTKYCGIDIEKEGYVIEDLELESIDKTIKTVMFLENKHIENKSKRLIRYINEQHSIINFEMNLRNLLYKVLNDQK
jgi:hypothetical protein